MQYKAKHSYILQQKKCRKGGIMQALYVMPTWACCTKKWGRISPGFYQYHQKQSSYVVRRLATSPIFDQSEAEKLSQIHRYTDTQTQNQHTVRPCSTSSACKKCISSGLIIASLLLLFTNFEVVFIFDISQFMLRNTWNSLTLLLCIKHPVANINHTSQIIFWFNSPPTLC